MRIVYVTDAFAVWGGMERVLTDKMNYLAECCGYDVFLLTCNQGAHPIPFQLHNIVRCEDLNLRMHQQYSYHGIKRLYVRRQLQRTLKEKMQDALCRIQPDIIVCVKLDFVGLLNKVRNRVPLVVESHTLCHAERFERVSWLRRIHIRSIKKAIGKANAVVSLTEGDAADWRSVSNMVHVIPNVVHINENVFFASCEHKSVLYVGRFSPQKDIDSLLRIWEIVHLQHPDWRLDIYGEGELEEYCLSKIQALNANIHVYKPIADIMEVYREHSILLLTSLFEPFGLVLPEAMSCGLPVVSFDCPYGPADIITDGVDGFLIKDRDVNLFAQRVNQLIDNYDLRRQMGQAGVLSSQRYQASHIMPQWVQLFEQLTSSQEK